MLKRRANREILRKQERKGYGVGPTAQREEPVVSRKKGSPTTKLRTNDVRSADDATVHILLGQLSVCSVLADCWARKLQGFSLVEIFPGPDLRSFFLRNH